MTYELDFAKLRAFVIGIWFELLEVFAPDLIPAIHKHPHHGPCPVHGGIDGFRFSNDVEKTGDGVCNTWGKCGGTA